MRPTALLCLIFGFMGMCLLDGQTFTHAVTGIVCGAIAIACGLGSARKDPPHRREGRILAALGFALAVWCLIMLPSSYRLQEKFNSRAKERQQLRDQQNPPSPRL